LKLFIYTSYFLALLISLSAQEVEDYKEIHSNDNSTLLEIENNNTNIALIGEKNETKSKELYLRYTKYPASVYAKQQFAVELEAIILTPSDKFDSIVSTYTNGRKINITSGDIHWELVDDNVYKTKIIYKILNKKFKLPTIHLTLKLGGTEVNHVQVKAPSISYSSIGINQNNFSNVIANNLTVKDTQIKQYNNKMLMVILNIKALESNLEDFNLSQFSEQGINSFENNYPIQNILYYAIIPSHLNNIKFNYYNPILAKFITIKLPVSLEDILVSTQTDLNPNNKNLLIYKKIILLAFLIIMILFYLFTRKKAFIAVALIASVIAISLFIPNKKILLRPGTKVYILPTQLSTVYKITNKTLQAEFLMEKNKFTKILFKNKNIGWIKTSDIK